MKFFLDTANLDELDRALAWGIIDGVTTNPTLIAKEGIAMCEQLRRICERTDGDVSAPVISSVSRDMVHEGRELASLHGNIVIKVPMTEEGIKAVSALRSDGIRTNVTLCFTAAQALIAAKSGAYFVSPFFARVEDAGGSGQQLIEDIARIYSAHGFATQILAASLRSREHVEQAAKAGAHIATLPFKLMESLFRHPLTAQGIEQFASDYSKVFDPVKA
ncbi:MAG: fructose-6-phosphate aldolase [Acidobacteriaceae bacterium]|nr:fructose-6-phosphate aldolase [Acidobacteriaceae bacterium]